MVTDSEIAQRNGHNGAVVLKSAHSANSALDRHWPLCAQSS